MIPALDPDPKHESSKKWNHNTSSSERSWSSHLRVGPSTVSREGCVNGSSAYCAVYVLMKGPRHYSTALSENCESRVSLEEQRVRSESSSKCFCFLRTFQWRHSASEANQSEIWSCAHIDGTG